MPTLLHSATRETPAEFRADIECGVCFHKFADTLSMGKSCNRCGSHICDEHEREVSLSDGTRYCVSCRDAEGLRACDTCGWLHPVIEMSFDFDFELWDCRECLQNEVECNWELNQQSLMESGGVDDSAYRREMKDAGRGHLVA